MYRCHSAVPTLLYSIRVSTPLDRKLNTRTRSPAIAIASMEHNGQTHLRRCPCSPVQCSGAARRIEQRSSAAKGWHQSKDAAETKAHGQHCQNIAGYTIHESMIRTYGTVRKKTTEKEIQRKVKVARSLRASASIGIGLGGHSPQPTAHMGAGRGTAYGSAARVAQGTTATAATLPERRWPPEGKGAQFFTAFPPVFLTRGGRHG